MYKNLDLFKSLTLLYIESNKTIMNSHLPIFKLIFRTVYTAIDFESALNIYKMTSPDILITNIGTEQPNGLELIKTIRKTDIKIPIFFLTTQDNKQSILKAANLQIDGYIIKPCNIEEIYEVMLHVLKKINTSSIIYLDKKLSYNFKTKELLKNHSVVSLGKKENNLLEFFLINQKRTIYTSEIEDLIWDNQYITKSAIKNLIGVLRRKIGATKIVNIFGIGWKINLEQ